MKSEWIIGRAPDCDLVLDHPKVSRRHARIVRSASGPCIEDLRSMSGTAVNGRRLTGPTPLGPGDVVQIGPYQLPAAQGQLATLLELARVATGGGLPRRDEERRTPGRFVPWLWALLAVAVAGVVAVAINVKKPRGSTSEGTETPGTTVVTPDASAASGEDRMPPWVYEAVFMIAMERGGEVLPVGTGFVPEGRQVIVTNAHVAEPIATMCAGGSRCQGIVIGGEHAERRHRIRHIRMHPHLDASAEVYRPDVAVLEVERADELPRGLPLADGAEVSNEGLRDRTVMIVGFPGDTMEAGKPSPTIDRGTVGRVTKGDYIQHSANMTPGNSGSPLLVRGPKVVGINYAGLGIRLVPTVNAEGRIELQRINQASGLNLAASVRFLRDLL